MKIQEFKAPRRNIYSCQLQNLLQGGKGGGTKLRVFAHDCAVSALS